MAKSIKRKIDAYASWNLGKNVNVPLNIGLTLYRKGKDVFESETPIYEIEVKGKLTELVDNVRSIGHVTIVKFKKGILALITKTNYEGKDCVKVELKEWE